MADEDEPQHKVEYLDRPDGEPEEANWVTRAGKARVTYPNGHIFEGTFDAEKIKQGPGVYTWMTSSEEDEETKIEAAKFEGNYKDGKKTGYGKMTFPNGDIYQGEWFENVINGEGSYTYKTSGDIYSGSWLNGKKNGDGRYEFGADSSMFVGTWENGEIKTGKWEMKGAAVYEGGFKGGRPYGPGKISFESGLKQTGAFVDKKPVEGEEEEEEPEEGAVKAPKVEWNGDLIVTF